ncbi:Glycosyltransferase family 2 protein [Vibrio chagasii]|nr:Glycosyltransferase family 2 protein [Vibrio chagasii]CAH7427228.1 Glycosyltransferase family 2 protein [Vibrio chagasii]
MKVYISIISHNHSDLIRNLECVDSLCDKFNVIIKSNTPHDDFSFLTDKARFYHVDEEYSLGFGRNNNTVFKYCIDELGMKDNDIFIVLNPDVIISSDALANLVELMVAQPLPITAINLYRDCEFKLYDHSVRRFPKLLDFIKSFSGFKNETIINKASISNNTNVDWAAGSFIGFYASHYKALKGFDEGYFMYCEDVDICFRSKLINKPVTYIPSIKAVHLGKHNNRKIMSMHFLWHLKSVFRFLLARAGLVKARSII